MISLNTTLRQHGLYYYTCCRKQYSDEGEFDSGIFEVGGESHDPLNFHCIIRNTRVSCFFEMHDSCVEWALSYHMSGESAVHKYELNERCLKKQVVFLDQYIFAVDD